jgi:hypothetical protein
VQHEKACPNRPPPGENDRTPGAKAPRFSVGQILFTLKNSNDIKINNSNSLFQRSQNIQKQVAAEVTRLISNFSRAKMSHQSEPPHVGCRRDFF